MSCAFIACDKDDDNDTASPAGKTFVLSKAECNFTDEEWQETFTMLDAFKENTEFFNDVTEFGDAFKVAYNNYVTAGFKENQNIEIEFKDGGKGIVSMQDYANATYEITWKTQGDTITVENEDLFDAEEGIYLEVGNDYAIWHNYDSDKDIYFVLK